MSEILEELGEAVKVLEASKEFVSFIPEVRANIAYAKPNPKTLEDIAGVEGRISVADGYPKACGRIMFGGSNHLGRVILAFGGKKRAVINLKFSEKNLQRLKRYCLTNKLVLGFVDRSKEPKEVKAEEGITMAWNAKQVLVSTGGKLPDFYYATGAVGKEDMILCFGEQAADTVEKALDFIKFEKVRFLSLKTK